MTPPVSQVCCSQVERFLPTDSIGKIGNFLPCGVREEGFLLSVLFFVSLLALCMFALCSGRECYFLKPGQQLAGSIQREAPQNMPAKGGWGMTPLVGRVLFFQKRWSLTNICTTPGRVSLHPSCYSSLFRQLKTFQRPYQDVLSFQQWFYCRSRATLTKVFVDHPAPSSQLIAYLLLSASFLVLVVSVLLNTVQHLSTYCK